MGTEFLSDKLHYLAAFLIGLLFLGSGVFLLRMGMFDAAKVEILDRELPQNGKTAEKVVVEIEGAVERPGVYTLNSFDRVDTLLIAAGGLAADADREWVAKNLNRAAKLVDGGKIYIPSIKESKNYNSSTVLNSQTAEIKGLININNATQAELESLPGIGPVRAQNIIANRPYASTDELTARKIISKSVYDKIKDKITAP
jgi:competence protein ComEA